MTLFTIPLTHCFAPKMTSRTRNSSSIPHQQSRSEIRPSYLAEISDNVNFAISIAALKPQPLDDEHDNVEIAGSVFLPSKILYLLDATQYEAVRVDWKTQQAIETADRGAQ